MKRVFPLFILLVLVFGCIPITQLTSINSTNLTVSPDVDINTKINDSFYYGLVKNSDGEYISGSHGLIILINNKNAKNPTYKELFDFLSTDNTDRFLYSGLAPFTFIKEDPHYQVDKNYLLNIIKGVTNPPSPSLCADYAELLHNNAEIAGIKAGYVCTQDHALNIFETTDKGIVYIDDTGEDYSSHYAKISFPGSSNITLGSSTVTFGTSTNYDKVAFIKIGKPLGLISLNVVSLYGFDYSGYEKWKNAKSKFDQLHNEYGILSNEYINQVNGREVIPQAEYQILLTRYNDLERRLTELKNLSNDLGVFWESPGIVSEVTITWDGY